MRVPVDGQKLVPIEIFPQQIEHHSYSDQNRRNNSRNPNGLQNVLLFFRKIFFELVLLQSIYWNYAPFVAFIDYYCANIGLISCSVSFVEHPLKVDRVCLRNRNVDSLTYSLLNDSESCFVHFVELPKNETENLPKGRMKYIF